MTGLDRKKDDEIIEVLRMMAPGTSLREGLDNILLARTGALIVIGDSEKVLSLVDGGFYINKDYTPAHIYELAKMDGAIILSKDLKKNIVCQRTACSRYIDTYGGDRYKTQNG